MRTLLLGSRVGLRPYRPDDAPALYEAARASTTEMKPWMPWCHDTYGLSDSEEFIDMAVQGWKLGTHHSFVVFDRDTDAFVGGVGINFINAIHRFANLGYWVRSQRTGRGLASEAARLGARFGLDDLGLQRIEIVVAVDNVASRRVAVKAGALQEGILRNRLCLHGVPVDAVMYSIVS